ncbi:MAG: FAD-dependent oxidoreductase [Bacteroidetes bacterium]|nr:FAD-dependent oxidoreductase [Bacteroidota bacterium]
MKLTTRTAEIIIIGGGVMGASLAYHLSKRGCTDVTVLEKGKAIGEGSTGKATGGFRTQFSTEVNIKLSILSRDKLKTFQEEVGIDSGYSPNGYLFIIHNQETFNKIKSIRTLQNNCGLNDVFDLSINEVQKLQPFINLQGAFGGVYCPSDGFINPINILQGYTNKAKELGVKFIYKCDCEKFEVLNNRIVTVSTSSGVFFAETFVNAAGAWASIIAEKAGIKLNVTPLKRQVAVLQEIDLLPSKLPMTIFLEDGFHFRVRNRQLLLLNPTLPETIDPFDTKVEPNWLKKTHEISKKRIPILKHTSIDIENSWAGLYEMSPDEHAIIGKSELENFYFMNGSSGHGIMHAPALGQLLAEEILDGKAHSLDISALRPSRFKEGKLNLNLHLL